MGKEVLKEVAKEVAKDVYTDGAKPVVKPTGELLGLVPRAIKAALCPVEKWILRKEYNLAETEKLLEKKLENVPPELIEKPEPHIAVPAIQYISYCMDNEELREMYANLLANSMNKVVKKGVHPAFVEIIKQLSPDEAKIMKYLSNNRAIPIIDLRAENETGQGIDIITSFSNIGFLCGCDYPLDIGKYFDNLLRLGLIIKPDPVAYLVGENLYKPLEEHPYITASVNTIEKSNSPRKKARLIKSYFQVTDFGQSFCNVCINNPKTIRITINSEIIGD